MLIRKNALIVLFALIASNITFGTLWGEGEPVVSQPELIRADLVLPDDMWSNICGKVGLEGKSLGYTKEEMANFPEHPYKLRKVENLYKDVRLVSEFSGFIGDKLLENKSNPGEVVNLCYQLMDASAGRGIEIPTGDNWGCDLIPEGTLPEDAIRYFWTYEVREGDMFWESWKEFPEGLQRFVIRMMVAAYRANPILQEAYNEEFLKTTLGETNFKEAFESEIYKIASAPFADDENHIKSETYKLFDEIDLANLALGSVLYLKHANAAIDEFNHWRENNEMEIKDGAFVVFATKIGTIMVIGNDDGFTPSRGALIVNLEGNSKYREYKTVERNYENLVTTIVDVSGNDDYGDADSVAEYGCGLFGLNAVFDLEGNDTYECKESGIGSGWFGTGLVMDYSGDDRYITHKSWGQGAAHAGVGALIDLAGNDEYRYGDQSQGLGSTLGVGLLLDATGDDKYLHTEEVRKAAHDPERDFNVEPAASLSQGCGFGRRADFSDGHSLAGGIGIMIEGDGNDEYEGLGRFAQGTGYWWGLGILEDYCGDDIYNGYWYAQGASAHFAIGCHVDLKGNDKYNNDFARSQFLGNGRDGSLAVFIDGSGDDYYIVCDRSAGVGDLNGIGWFWDKDGDDYYKIQTGQGFTKTPVIGAATTQSGLERTFRAVMKSIGVFVDTGGNDTYDDEMYMDTYVTDRKLQAGNDKEWWHNEGPVLWGYGIDN